MSAELAVLEPSRNTEIVAGYHSNAAFDLLQRAGKMLASSNLVPETYRGNVADCSLIVEIALRIKASPLLVANNLDIIHGRPGWRSQFLIASVNTCGRYSTLHYEWQGTPGGKDRGCRAWAIEKASGDRLDGVWITWEMASAEGWITRSGSKWKTMPEQMFVYRSAAFWTRAYAPEIALGFPTSDEVRDTIDVTPTRNGNGASTAIADLNAGITSALAITAIVDPAVANPDAVSYATVMAELAKAEKSRDPADFGFAQSLLARIADAQQRAEADVELQRVRKIIEGK